MKKYLVVAVALACTHSNGMIDSSRLQDNVKLEIQLDTRTKTAVINDNVGFPVPYKVKDEVSISIFIPAGLLSNFVSSTATFERSLRKLLSSLGFYEFELDLVENCVFTEEPTKTELLDGSKLVVQTYLRFLKDMLANNFESIEKISKMELCFGKILQKIESLSGDNSSNQDELYKVVSIALIKEKSELCNTTLGEISKPEREKIVAEYNQDCLDRLAILMDMASQGKIALGPEECYSVVEVLNNSRVDDCLLLSELSSAGLSLIKTSNGVFCSPDLQTTKQVLSNLDVVGLKKDVKNLLLYVAAMYCLSNIDKLFLPMSAYEVHVESEKNIRTEIITLAKQRLTELLQMNDPWTSVK